MSTQIPLFELSDFATLDLVSNNKEVERKIVSDLKKKEQEFLNVFNTKVLLGGQFRKKRNLIGLQYTAVEWDKSFFDELYLGTQKPLFNKIIGDSDFVDKRFSVIEAKNFLNKEIEETKDKYLNGKINKPILFRIPEGTVMQRVESLRKTSKNLVEKTKELSAVFEEYVSNATSENISLVEDVEIVNAHFKFYNSFEYDENISELGINTADLGKSITRLYGHINFLNCEVSKTMDKIKNESLYRTLPSKILREIGAKVTEYWSDSLPCNAEYAIKKMTKEEYVIFEFDLKEKEFVYSALEDVDISAKRFMDSVNDMDLTYK